jgi:oxygen-independent coproporphyrinogen-3 oxidase
MAQNTSLISLSPYHRDQLQVFPTAAYIHIPFCRRRCYYCDFPISVVGNYQADATGNRGNSHGEIMIGEYVEALCREIKLAAFSSQPLETIFFGGGTPSLLSVKHLSTILQTIDKQLGIASNAEISLEIDPGTFNLRQLQGYLDAGVNRISLGVQSFDEKLLSVCGRFHNLKDVFDAIDLIKQLDIKNFSLDLISGLPHQTLEQCQNSLETAIKIAPNHLSCYDLVLEPVTAFGKQYQPGEKPLPNDTDTAEMYRLTQNILTNSGYEHYEVSNYAQVGFQCRHNKVYWENKSYYGFGMGAASYVNGQRFTRPRTRREYYTWLKQGAVIDVPVTSFNDWLLEKLMLGLRLTTGINLAEFDLQIIEKILNCLQLYGDRNWVEIVKGNGQIIDYKTLDLSLLNRDKTITLRLSDPEGFLFSNTILSTLFEKLESVN